MGEQCKRLRARAPWSCFWRSKHAAHQDPTKAAGKHMLFVAWNLLGVGSAANRLFESLPKGTGCQVRDRMSEPPWITPGEGERAATVGIPAPFPPTLLSSPHLYLLPFPIPWSCISYVRQDSPHSRLLERGRVFLKAGLTVAQNKCLTPVTVSQQAQARCPLLLRRRLSPPTPDSIACQCLKSPFCLCHFISKTSFRLEE